MYGHWPCVCTPAKNCGVELVQSTWRLNARSGSSSSSRPMSCKLLIITVGLSGECVVNVDLAMTATMKFLSFSEQLYYDTGELWDLTQTDRHTQTGRERERETDRQTDRQTDRCLTRVLSSTSLNRTFDRLRHFLSRVSTAMLTRDIDNSNSICLWRSGIVSKQLNMSS